VSRFYGSTQTRQQRAGKTDFVIVTQGKSRNSLQQNELASELAEFSLL